MDWVEYKIIKQYRPLGEILDSMRLYGYRGAVEQAQSRAWNPGEDSFVDCIAEEAAQLHKRR